MSSAIRSLVVGAASLTVKNTAVQSVAFLGPCFTRLERRKKLLLQVCRSCGRIEQRFALPERPKDWMTSRLTGILPPPRLFERVQYERIHLQHRSNAAVSRRGHQILYPPYNTAVTEGSLFCVCFNGTLYSVPDLYVIQNRTTLQVLLCCVESYSYVQLAQPVTYA